VCGSETEEGLNVRLGWTILAFLEIAESKVELSCLGLRRLGDARARAVIASSSAPSLYLAMLRPTRASDRAVLAQIWAGRRANESLDDAWDYLITVGDSANEVRPVFPRAVARLHWHFDHPSAARGSDDEGLAVFRRVRDEIKTRITGWLQQSTAEEILDLCPLRMAALAQPKPLESTPSLQNKPGR